MMVSKYSAQQVVKRYIDGMETGIAKLWDEFAELDLENVRVKDDIEYELQEIERQVNKAIANMEAIQFEE
ncbi:MAG: hypothetical protein IJP29_03770 [Lachnospiraceae bacterium]|nr:hypothetical protein [Lachnospiraceae bacterium]